MMYPRLFVARQLLRDDGVIFASVDDNEVHNLRMLMNEVFGEENRIECFVWKKSYGGGAKERYAVTQHEYVLLYARAGDLLEDLWLPPDPETERRYYKYRDDKFEARGPYRLKPLEATKSMDRRENLVFPIPLPQGGEVRPRRQWWWGRDRVLRAIANDELVFTQNGDSVSVSYKQYLKDESGEKRGMKPFSIIDGIYTQHGTDDLTSLFDGQVVMQFPKPVALMKRLLNTGTDAERGDIVLDFFAGSCATAQAVLELNREHAGDRRFIMVQLPEPLDAPISLNSGTELRTIADIGKERIRRVIQKLQTADGGQKSMEHRETPEDLGFRVYELAESSFRQWSPPPSDAPDAVTSQMGMFADPLLDGWKPEHVICEVALKEGFGMNCQIERIEDVAGNTVWRVTDPDQEQSFRICLDAALDPEAIRSLNLGRDDIFICRDVALDDSLAANLALQCRLKVI
jgi:adenine-specific DNA-methyltransferase